MKNKVAIAFMTKDRPELTAQSIEPLLQKQFDLFWIDGSATKAGEDILSKYPVNAVHTNIRGGPDAAVMYALTFMLQHPNRYTHVGIIENDVLLHKDWFGPTMALFERGEADGLDVGAVSPRCYSDRILCQRDGYALVHNLGFGITIMTRQAAGIVMGAHRTSSTIENRRTFAKLSDLDIGRWWAFKNHLHWITGDWGTERILAAHGLAALALTPSPVEMIGQFPSLEEQGLVLSVQPFELLRNDRAFQTFGEHTAYIRAERWFPCDFRYARQGEDVIYFAHQLRDLGAIWEGDWQLKWTQGFGPFTWKARAAGAELTMKASGQADFMIGGGPDGGEVEITSGDWRYQPTLVAEGEQGVIMHIRVPGDVDYRLINVRALTPGVSIYGLRTREPQPFYMDQAFSYLDLPPV